MLPEKLRFFTGALCSIHCCVLCLARSGLGVGCACKTSRLKPVPLSAPLSFSALCVTAAFSLEFALSPASYRGECPNLHTREPFVLRATVRQTRYMKRTKKTAFSPFDGTCGEEKGSLLASSEAKRGRPPQDAVIRKEGREVGFVGVGISSSPPRRRGAEDRSAIRQRDGSAVPIGADCGRSSLAVRSLLRPALSGGFFAAHDLVIDTARRLHRLAVGSSFLG